uniref:Uncharacterized protein n=2 Tax=Lactuca sativa TaxID=4236 RepID=A0A9R1X7M1_LACSA|nr:hypothetical protein LSAT_V11C500260570 [Lactuca sativa]KAJ0207926.1 hypothetical protein LSAT_V11C500260580 [Lactuca sativa]
MDRGKPGVLLKARLPNRSCNKFLTIFVDNSTASRFNLEDHALTLTLCEIMRLMLLILTFKLMVYAILVTLLLLSQIHLSGHVSTPK